MISNDEDISNKISYFLDLIAQKVCYCKYSESENTIMLINVTTVVVNRCASLLRCSYPNIRELET